MVHILRAVIESEKDIVVFEIDASLNYLSNFLELALGAHGLELIAGEDFAGADVEAGDGEGGVDVVDPVDCSLGDVGCCEEATSLEGAVSNLDGVGVGHQ